MTSKTDKRWQANTTLNQTKFDNVVTTSNEITVFACDLVNINMQPERDYKVH